VSDIGSTESPTIGAIVSSWRKRQRVSYAHIARPGRLSRNTIKLIADGVTRRPSHDTLVKIAVGLALDPYDKTIDREVLGLVLHQFQRVVGYQDLLDPWLTTTLEVLLATIVVDTERARAWLTLMAMHHDADVSEIEQFAGVIADHRHREPADPNRPTHSLIANLITPGPSSH
jgi:hypothetical protein